MSRITVIGAGYVGLVTAAGLARLGHSVAALEIDQVRLSRILAGHLPIHEPGLDALVHEGRAAGLLEFSDNYAAMIPPSDFVFLAVATPARADGEADTSQVFAATRRLLAHARPGLTIVTKSTVPVGTGDEIERLAAEAGVRVTVASNPEFLREGSAVRDFLQPDRIVVGAHDPHDAQRVADLYAALDAPAILTQRRSAELAKYAANALLASRISFMNEIAAISDALGADIADIERVVGSDARIGPAFLRAGLGWGGSCFPKDLSELAATANRIGASARIVEAVVQVNAAQRERAFELLRAGTRGRRDPVVGVLGLAFKPDTDDLRGSPALDVIRHLLDADIAVQAHDPAAMPQARLLLPAVRYAADPYAALTGVDALLIATEWPEYQALDWSRIRRLMRGHLVVDGRNILHGGLLTGLGFDYRAFGRGAPDRATTRDGVPESSTVRGVDAGVPGSTLAEGRAEAAGDRVA